MKNALSLKSSLSSSGISSKQYAVTLMPGSSLLFGDKSRWGFLPWLRDSACAKSLRQSGPLL